MAEHAYERRDADGNVAYSFDFPDVGFTPSIEDMTNQFCIEQALYKMIADDVSTRSAGNLRDSINQHYLELYRTTGARTFDLKMLGGKVGTVSIKANAPKPKPTQAVAEVTDREKLDAYDDPDFLAYCTRWLAAHLPDIGRDYFEETGAMPDGMELVEYETPADTPKPTVSIRVDADKVAAAVDARALGNIVHGMLEG